MKKDAKPAILEHLRSGHYRKDAANLEGVSFQQFNVWRHDDPEFAEGIKRAEAESISALVERIRSASEDPQRWTAAAWLLERRFPQRWGKRERLDQKTTLTVEPSKMTDAELAAALREEAARLEEKGK